MVYFFFRLNESIESGKYMANDGITTAQYEVKDFQFRKLSTHLQVLINGPTNQTQLRPDFDAQILRLQKMIALSTVHASITRRRAVRLAL